MRFYAFMMGDRITDASAANGCPEESGYYDPKWSRTTIFENRNDVAPISWFDPSNNDGETVEEWIHETILGEFGDAYDDNGDGTIYGHDGYTEPKTGDFFGYALQFVVKAHTSEVVPDGLSVHIERY